VAISPVTPSIESSKGKTWILVKFYTLPAAFTITSSPNLTDKFFLVTLFILILPPSSYLSTKAIHKVYFYFLPLIKTGSPLKMSNSANLAADI
jgi:hypothetical protein